MAHTILTTTDDAPIASHTRSTGNVNMTMTSKGPNGRDTTVSYPGIMSTQGSSARMDLHIDFGGMTVESTQLCTEGTDSVSLTQYTGNSQCTAMCLNGHECPSFVGDECSCELANLDDNMNQMLRVASAAGACANSDGSTKGMTYAMDIPGGQGHIEVCIADDNTPAYLHVQMGDAGSEMIEFFDVKLGSHGGADAFTVPSDCTCTTADRALRGETAAPAPRAKAFAHVARALSA